MPEPGISCSHPASEASGQPAPQIIVVPARSHTVWWVLTVVLAVIATALVTRRDADFLPAALAQSVSGAGPMQGSRGIYAFTGQLTSKSFGLFMMDTDSGTVWCYEFQRGPSGEPQMRLVGARSWVYDRYLEEFNVADPVPSAVKVLVQQQRAAAAAGASAPVPGTPQAPVEGSGIATPALPGGAPLPNASDRK